MPHITYTGDISPGVWLSFKGRKSTGAHSAADDDWVYHVENECLFEWSIVFNTGSRAHTLTRRASQGQRFFSDDANTYLNPPVSASVLNDILDAKDAGTLTVTVTCKTWYHKFFRFFLANLRRTDSTFENLAFPTDEAEIQASVTRNGSRFSYLREEKELRDIPADLSGYRVIPPASGSGAPTVKLFIYMKVKENLAANDADEVTEILVSSDYTKVNRFGEERTNSWSSGRTPVPTIERSLRTWEKNVWQFFANYASLTRGDGFVTDIFNAADAMATAGGSQAEIVGIVRDEIDRYLITANHWGQRREDRTLESYQNHMSNAFGSIHQTRWRASPVRVMRLLSGDMNRNFSGRATQRLDLREKAAFALQAGCGHCGEHSTVSFRCLAAVHANGHAATLGSIVKTGNANIDHAFVVGGIRPTEIVSTTVQATNNSRSSLGAPIRLWDLRAALTAAGASVDGYVCDPYLAPDVISQTARGLLAQLHSSRRRGANKHTDFLAFSLVFPDAPALTTRSVASVSRV